MLEKTQILEVIMSQLDWYVINQVKKIRRSKGISQADLSVKMGFSEKLVGSIENPTLKAKYNVSHLNTLAKALECTIHDLIPSIPFELDLIQLKIKRSFKVSKDGKPSKKTTLEVVEIRPFKSRR
jgi:transcriptional regulator with XRE-family HTH domain